MRQIIFRGRTGAGAWVHGDLIRNSFGTYIFPPDGGDSFDNYEVDPETVGQFTGLKDANGADICEGDILKTYDAIEAREYVNAVSYVWGCWQLVESEGCMPTEELHRLRQENIQVIGNIHDSPELLQTK